MQYNLYDAFLASHSSTVSISVEQQYLEVRKQLRTFCFSGICRKREAIVQKIILVKGRCEKSSSIVCRTRVRRKDDAQR
jgi:hypothetical protein